MLLDGTDHLLSTILACDIVDHDVGAGLSQADRHATADTRICSGDESLLPDERSGVGASDFESAVLIWTSRGVKS
jgi:hypothetical protein